MSKQKIVIFLIAIIGMIATFLPWYEIGSLGMIMGYQTVGWFTFIMFALVFLFCPFNRLPDCCNIISRHRLGIPSE